MKHRGLRRHAHGIVVATLTACFLLSPAVSIDATGSDNDAGAKNNEFARRVVDAARNQVETRVRYDASYASLPYPAGDPPADRGACTDLLTRAWRAAGIDLQKEIHEDRKKRSDAYPSATADDRRVDSNIDHRRCRHLLVWFREYANEREDEATNGRMGDYPDWRGGDVVFLNFTKRKPDRPDHVGIVAGDRAPDGTPYIYDLFPPAARKRRVNDFPFPMVLNSRFRWPDAEPAGPPIAPRYNDDDSNEKELEPTDDG